MAVQLVVEPSKVEKVREVCDEITDAFPIVGTHENMPGRTILVYECPNNETEVRLSAMRAGAGIANSI